MGEIAFRFGVPKVDDESGPLTHLYRACGSLRSRGVDTSLLEVYGRHPSLGSDPAAAAATIVCRAELFMATELAEVDGAQTLVDEAAAVALHALVSVGVQESPAQIFN